MQVGEVFDPIRNGNLGAVKLLSVGRNTVRFEPLSGKDKGKAIKVGVQRFRTWYAPRPVSPRPEPAPTNGHRANGPVRLVQAAPVAPLEPEAPELEARIAAEPILVTPEMALAWLTEMPYRGQRAVRQHRVDELAEEMRQGRFRLSTIDIRRVGPKGSGQRYLINGQHRLLAIVESGIAQMMVVIESDGRQPGRRRRRLRHGRPPAGAELPGRDDGVRTGRRAWADQDPGVEGAGGGADDRLRVHGRNEKRVHALADRPGSVRSGLGSGRRCMRLRRSVRRSGRASSGCIRRRCSPWCW